MLPKPNLKKYHLYILSLILLSGIAFSVEGGSCQEHNVWGWAWSENIGWISMSCQNCDADFDGNWDGGVCGSGSSIDYGVDIDETTGEFSGYAWSENIGWITFNESELTGCPSSPCKAKVNLDTGEVSGWARALAHGGGWDGWIKLRDTDYGVWINKSTGEFHDWAWGGNDSKEEAVVGWISFNCENCEDTVCDSYPPCGDPAHPDYKVMTSFSFNQPPEKPGIDPKYPDGESWDHCSIQELSIPTLHWTYSDPDGDPQAASQIKIYGETTLETEELSCPPTCTSYTPANTWIEHNLNWGQTYSWQVRVKDNQGNWSLWSDENFFTMPSHAYPWIDFSWAPSSPNVDEIVQFTDQTTFYGGASGSSWSWEFGDGESSSLQNPTHSYSSAGSYSVTLEACDTSGYCCGPPLALNSRKSIQVSLPLPEWQEIPPF